MGKSRAWVTKILRGGQNLTLKTIIDLFWELGYETKFEVKPRFDSAAAWSENLGNYNSHQLVTVHAPTSQATADDERFIEQPFVKLTEPKNVIAA